MEGFDIEDFGIEHFDLWFFEVLDKVDGASEWDGVDDGRSSEASERAFSIDLVCEVAVTFSPALTCPSQLGSGTAANEGTEGGAKGGAAGI